MPQKALIKTRERASRPAKSQGSDPTGLVTMVVGAVIVAYLFFTNPQPKTFEAYNFVNTGFCFWIPILTILLILRAEPSEFGLAVGDRRAGLKWMLFLWLAMLPCVIFASHLPAFREQYLNGRLSQPLEGVGAVFDAAHRVHLSALVYYELGMGFYFFCWEFFFRGFLLFGLQRSRTGTWGAVIIQSLPFMLLHWSWQSYAAKPNMEILGSLPAALILAFVAVRTKSILYGYIAHWAVSATLDICLLAPFIHGRFG